MSRNRFALILFAIIAINCEHGARAQLLSIGLCPNPTPMANFNTHKYLGRWYELAKFWDVPEALFTCVKVQYFSNGPTNDTFGIEASLTPTRRRNKRISLSGSTILRNARDGSADFIMDLNVIPIPIPFTIRLPYLILATDYHHYSIVWHCQQLGPLSLQYLWIFSKSKTLTVPDQIKVQRILREAGIPSQKLVFTDQRHCAH